MTAIIEISRDDGDIRVAVKGVLVSASRGYRDRYGAQEEPDEPAYIEIESAAVVEDVVGDLDGRKLYSSGQLIDLTAEEDEKAEAALWEKMQKDYAY